MLANRQLQAQYDSDAQAFITASGITSTVQKDAVNTLVTQLKGAGLWTKMRALYPFAGETAEAHKYNLKDPRDLDAAYRISFTGGTHSANKVDFNGTSDFGDTHFPANGMTDQNSIHMSYYSKTNSAEGTAEQEMGAADGSNWNMRIILKWVTSPYMEANTAGYYSLASPLTDTRGFFVVSRTNASSYKAFHDGVLMEDCSFSSSSMDSRTIYIGASNAGFEVFYTKKTCAFASIGNGLAPVDVSAFTTIVNTYLSNSSGVGGTVPTAPSSGVYSGPTLFEGPVTIKSPAANNPYAGARNPLFLDAAYYGSNSSTIVFMKNAIRVADIGSDINATGGSDLYIAAGATMESPVLINPWGAGKVGIGTAYPSEKLSVFGNIFLPQNNSVGYLPSTEATSKN